MSVRQMSAVRQIHPQDLIAVLNCREIHGHVRLRAAVRLHIRVIRAKQFLRAINGSLFDDIRPFTTAVIALSGITLSVLVGENRTSSFEHGFTDEVLAGD